MAKYVSIIDVINTIFSHVFLRLFIIQYIRDPINAADIVGNIKAIIGPII